MPDKRKDGQYDIVEQAEDVLRAYVKRYYAYEQKLLAKRKREKQYQNRLLISAVIAAAALSLVLLSLLMLH